MRALGLDDGAQGGGVGHGHHMGAVCDLLGRRIGVAVDGDDLAAQPLQLEGEDPASTGVVAEPRISLTYEVKARTG